MGAAASASSNMYMNNIDSDIYISNPENSEFLNKLEEKMTTELNYKIFDKTRFKDIIKTQTKNDISNMIETIIDKTKYLFVCISPKTLNNVIQTLEMNEILNISDRIEHKIIYFMLDRDYNTTTNPELNSFIKNNKCFDLYDDNSLLETTNKLLSLLI
jgi:hypothetical protein